MDDAPDTPRLTPRQIDRRNRILDAARRLTAESGFDAVSMRTIASESKVAEKTLYNIFGTKVALIAAAARDRTANVFELAAQRAPDGGWSLLLAFADCATEITLAAPNMARALAPILIEHQRLVALERLYDEHIPVAVAAMVATGMLRPDVDPAGMARLIRLAVVAGVLFWAQGDLTNDELGAYLRLRLGEMFLPLACEGHRGVIESLIVEARQGLIG